MDAYDSLAEWFEYLNDDCGYGSWSQYFIEGLARRNAGRRGLELGCGTAPFSRILVKNGYTMTGADRSEGMLRVASRKAAEEGIALPLVRADARRLSVSGKFDFILSPNDCFNYVPPAALAGAFRKVRGALVPGGLFWFDVSSPCKLREKIANNMFADDREEVTYLSFNKLFEDRVEMNVTLFVRGKDGRFTRFDELHTQYIHEEDNVVPALEGAGFEVLSVEGHLGEPKEGSDRLNFICRKA